MPQHLLRYLRNWLFLQITPWSVTLSWLPKGLEKEGGCPCGQASSPRLVCSSFKFTVICLMYRHILKQIPHYHRQLENQLMPLREIRVDLTRDGLQYNFRASNWNFLKKGTLGSSDLFEWRSQVSVWRVKWCKSEMTEDRHVQPALRTCVFQRCFFREENLRSVPPATDVDETVTPGSSRGKNYIFIL